MPLLSAKKQLAAAVETVAGSDPSAFPAASDATTLPSELAVSPEVDMFVRDFIRDGATPLKATAGKKTAGVSFKAEMKGTAAGTHATGAPNWSKFLQACGFEEVEVSVTTIGAVTGGPFRHGEIISQAVSGATAVVVGDTHNGTTELLLDKDSIVGTINDSGLWTGAETGATATPSTTESDEGFAWRLITTPRKKFTLTAGGWSGTAPSDGDVLEGATSGARCIYREDQSTLIIEYTPLRGTFTASETIDNITDPETTIGTLESPTGEAYEYGPPMAMRVYEDGVAVSLNGARGSVALEFEVNRPVRFAFEFRGIFSEVADYVNLTGIDYDYTNPPLWAGITSGFADNENAADVDVTDEQDPCLRTLNLDIGAQLADRECASDTDGLAEIIIPTREGSFSMDPEATPESDIGWVTALRNGQVQRLRTAVGTSDGNRFTVLCPGLQIESAGGGDRDGIMTRDISGKLTGGDLHNLNGTPASLSEIGGDNEIVLVYHTS